MHAHATSSKTGNRKSTERAAVDSEHETEGQAEHRRKTLFQSMQRAAGAGSREIIKSNIQSTEDVTTDDMAKRGGIL